MKQEALRQIKADTEHDEAQARERDQEGEPMTQPQDQCDCRIASVGTAEGSYRIVYCPLHQAALALLAALKEADGVLAALLFYVKLPLGIKPPPLSAEKITQLEAIGVQFEQAIAHATGEQH